MGRNLEDKELMIKQGRDLFNSMIWTRADLWRDYIRDNYTNYNLSCLLEYAKSLKKEDIDNFCGLEINLYNFLRYSGVGSSSKSRKKIRR